MLNHPDELDVAALQDAIEKNAAEIKYWEDAPITSVADAVVKQDKLKPLYSERENLAQQHRVMRGDYTEAYPGPKTTVLSTETVAAFGSSNSVAADKAGLLVRAPAQSPATPAPVVAVGASGGVESVIGKRWTPEKLAELKSYREKHGTKKAAKFFCISEQLVRQKLPSEKPQPKGYSAFTHRPK